MRADVCISCTPIPIALPEENPLLDHETCQGFLFCSQNYADFVKLPWRGFFAVKKQTNKQKTGSNFWFIIFKYYIDNLLISGFFFFFWLL